MIKTIDVEESVEKKVVGFGNGSIVYTPKRWIGRKALVVLEKKPWDVESAVLEILKPHLGKVMGISLFGSYARKEQADESDIDVLVIAGKKFSLAGKGKFDFMVKTKEDFARELRGDNSLYFYQVLREAKPILNEPLLKELKRVKIRPDFKEFLNSTLGAFKIVNKLLEVDRKRGKKYLDSNACVYSLILRLRTLFLIQNFPKKRAFSSKKFMELLKSHDFNDEKARGLLEVYRAERDNRKPTARVLLYDAEKLFNAAKLEFLKTEKLVKK